jgi:hypothetical protein
LPPDNFETIGCLKASHTWELGHLESYGRKTTTKYLSYPLALLHSIVPLRD